MDLEPGEQWLGLYNLTSPGADGVYSTVSQNVATGKTTTLSCPRQGRNFNWAYAPPMPLLPLLLQQQQQPVHALRERSAVPPAGT